MKDFEPPKFFFGRERELSWALYQLNSDPPPAGPVIISGESGIGKTALLAQLFKMQGRRRRPGWYGPPPIKTKGKQHRPLWYRPPPFGLGRALDGLHDLIRQDSAMRGTINGTVLVIDQVDTLNEDDLELLVKAGKQFKLIDRVFVTTRQHLRMQNAPRIELTGLAPDEAEILFSKLSGKDATDRLTKTVFDFTKGSPGYLTVVARMFQTGDVDAVERFIRGRALYEISQAENEGEIILVAKPRIILANENLIERLRKEPQSIYHLPPRRFEETIAELLEGMGMQVELTPQSHDDGRDILAYLDTPIGKFLTLVECKRYRADNKVGIELVKQLFGTLMDSHANRAMMVTTSSFTSGACDFQKKYEWQMELRDFSHVSDWITKHKQPKLVLPD